KRPGKPQARGGAFVALYRGINVGGNNPVRMEALRAMHEKLGHSAVASYIQSGNVVFGCGSSAGAAARAIGAHFLDHFGFASRVIVVPAGRWQAIVRANPYAKTATDDPKKVHAAICDGAPDVAGLKALLGRTGGRESFEVRDEVIYLQAPDGLGSSKFAAGMEKAPGGPITVPAWRTS